MNLREAINKKPWIGYLLVAVGVGGGVFLYMRLNGSGDPDSVARLSETVTIRDSETGDEWKMRRGLMEKELIEESALGKLDTKMGLKNPKTGKATGFPIDSSWEATIQRINEERALQAKSGPLRGSGPDTPAATPPAKGK